MSDPGDAPSDMSHDLPASDADLDRLLRGHTPADRPDLAGATAFVAAMSALGDTAPAPRGALAALLADGFDPAALPAAPVVVPRRSRWATLRRPAARLAGASLAVKVLTGTGVAMAAVTGVASTGSLPDPAQERIGAVLETVTPFEFPGGRPSSPVVPPAPAQDRGEDTPPVVVPPSQPAESRPPVVVPTPPVAPPSARPSDRPSERPSDRPSARPSPPARASERPTPAPARPTPARPTAPDRETPPSGAPEREAGERAPETQAPAEPADQAPADDAPAGGLAPPAPAAAAADSPRP